MSFSELISTLKAGLASGTVFDVTKDERAALVPNGYSLETFRSKFATDPRQAVERVFYDRESLALYCQLYKEPGAILLSDYESAQITALLTYHLPGKGEGNLVQENLHKATLQLRYSEEFARWNKFVAAGWHDQAAFALFLEENCEDVTTPAPTTLMEIARDFQAEQGTAARVKTNTQTGDRTIEFVQETKQKTAIEVPQKILLSLPIYYGEDPAELEAHFRFSIRDGSVHFRLEWRRLEFIRQQTFMDIAASLSTDTEVPAFLGK